MCPPCHLSPAVNYLLLCCCAAAAAAVRLLQHTVRNLQLRYLRPLLAATATCHFLLSVRQRNNVTACCCCSLKPTTACRKLPFVTLLCWTSSTCGSCRC
ncbi:unnamed protein product, partial [Ectocarpus fasciculatus]